MRWSLFRFTVKCDIISYYGLMPQNASYVFPKKNQRKQRQRTAGSRARDLWRDRSKLIQCATQPLLLSSWIKLIVFQIFCPWSSTGELKDILEKNKQGFDSKSGTLTHFVAFEEHYGRQVSRKTNQRNVKNLAESACTCLVAALRNW